MFPFLGGTNTFIGNALTAGLVNADAGLYVGKLSARRQGDKQYAASAVEFQFGRQSFIWGGRTVV